MQFAINSDGHMLASEAFMPEQFINVAMNTIYQVTLQFVHSLPEEDQPLALDSLYDTINTGASTVLEALIPDHLHPDLTAQAILEAENAILDREVPDTELQITKEDIITHIPVIKVEDEV